MAAPTYDPRERFYDHNETLNMALDGLQGRVWTALPGIITKVSFEGGVPVASVKLGVMGRNVSANGSVSFQNLPELPHCPLWFPRGGGFSLTFPVAAGDECIVLFSSRSIDEWWQGGKANPAYDLRMHDLSDGIALVGLTSKARPPKSGSIPTDRVQLSSDDGAVKMDVSAAGFSWTVGGHTLTIGSDGVTSNKGATFTGQVNSNTDVVVGDISLKNHTHTSEKEGSPTSSPIG